MRNTGARERLAAELEAEFNEALTGYRSVFDEADRLEKTLKKARRRSERYPDRPAPGGQTVGELAALSGKMWAALDGWREKLFAADERLGHPRGIDYTDIRGRALAAADRLQDAATAAPARRRTCSPIAP
jgi:hypothetical protein